VSRTNNKPTDWRIDLFRKSQFGCEEIDVKVKPGQTVLVRTIFAAGAIALIAIAFRTAEARELSVTPSVTGDASVIYQSTMR